MINVALKKDILATVDALPVEKVRVGLDFLKYLKERQEENEATAEILRDKKLVKQLRAARKDRDEGRHYRYTPWELIRRNV